MASEQRQGVLTPASQPAASNEAIEQSNECIEKIKEIRNNKKKAMRLKNKVGNCISIR